MENFKILTYAEFLFPDFLIQAFPVPEIVNQQLKDLKNGRFLKVRVDDFSSFIKHLKNQGDDDEELNVFDYFLYVDGLSFASCKCKSKDLEFFELPLEIDLESLASHEEFQNNRKFYKSSFKGLKMSELLTTTCKNCNQNHSKSFEIFQDSLKILTFSISGVYKKNIEKLKLLKSFPDYLNEECFSGKFFKLYSLLFQKEEKMIVLARDSHWMQSGSRVDFLDQIRLLFDEAFELRLVSYCSTAPDPSPIASLSLRGWRSLLFEYHEKSRPGLTSSQIHSSYFPSVSICEPLYLQVPPSASQSKDLITDDN